MRMSPGARSMQARSSPGCRRCERRLRASRARRPCAPRARRCQRAGREGLRSRRTPAAGGDVEQAGRTLEGVGPRRPPWSAERRGGRQGCRRTSEIDGHEKRRQSFGAVGARRRVDSPRAMAGQPSSWARVGSPSVEQALRRRPERRGRRAKRAPGSGSYASRASASLSPRSARKERQRATRPSLRYNQVPR